MKSIFAVLVLAVMAGEIMSGAMRRLFQ